MDTNILSTTQAAKKLGVSIRTVQYWYKLGHFPGAYKVNPMNPGLSHLRIPEKDVEKILDLRK